ncbi:uncharacterized protein BX663DRAFT_248752 [Cokeromyces recurvatus]|uniref:uncharacterized protein n=1 Tax=Cokeromyces recurvatus TaxID=90255 RepID=UPI0022207516|nr:uncharacterized protein BX663DRAFT_248752 [Cokeromyces recurvatus]KAI7906026.1 hypothetical protein BX663DRAFT_248752 [Cokeromyces recurvatus]
MSSKHPNVSCDSCNEIFKHAIQLKGHHKNYQQSPIVINYTNYEGESKTLTLDRDKDVNFICLICSLESKTSSGFHSHFSHQKGNCAPYLTTLQIYIDGAMCQMKPSFHRKYRCIICNVDIKEPKEHFKSQHINYNVYIKEVGEKRKIGTPTYNDLFYDRDKDFKRIRAEPLMKAFGLDLINIDLKHNQNSFKTTALINEKTFRSLKRSSLSTESSLDASMTFPNNELQYPETFTVCGLQKNIKIAISHVPMIF